MSAIFRNLSRQLHFAGILFSGFSIYGLRNKAMAESNSSLHQVKRLGPVEGLSGKINDVIVCHEASYSPASSCPLSTIVFFGGDVQDYSENMLAHRDNKHYEMWNLESTGKLLCQQFPGSLVYVVKPSVMYLKTFSSYVNFVDSDSNASPNHSRGQESWRHLFELLVNSYHKFMFEKEKEQNDGLNSIAEAGKFKLIGFSKGCVVLNQLLYDLPDALADGEISPFLNKVSDMYWLDGGHNGGSKTWITSEEVLHHLTNVKICIHSHVTPYQIKDSGRKWIGQEQKRFINILKRLNVDVTNTVHFAEEERSLENHFRVLTLVGME